MPFPVKSFAAAASAALICTTAAAQQMEVESGTTKPVRLSKAASSVVIGNQNIADVAVADPQLVFLTGKSFGTTNLLILDSDNNIILSTDVVVSVNSANLVTVNRAGSAYTYNCTSDCRDTPMIGDNDEHFGKAVSQAERTKALTEGR